MPGADDLVWIELKDFTAGLFERGNDREVTPNGLLVLTDAYPLRTGGLRAGFRWETYVDSSVADMAFGLPASTHQVAGFEVFHIARLPNARSRKFVVLQSDGVVGSAANGAFDIYGSTSSAATNQTSWSAVSTFSSFAGYQPTRIVQYATDFIIREYFHCGSQAPSTRQGVHRFAETPTAVDAKVSTAAAAFLVAHQRRLFSVGYFGHVGAGEAQRIQFTSVGASTGMDDSTNRFVLAPDLPGDVCYMESFFPGDLFALKREWGWFSMQGEFPTPFIRQETLVSPPGEFTWGTRIPSGIAYLTNDDGVYVHSGGNYPRPLSPQFVGTPMTELVLDNSGFASPQPSFIGELLYADQWLFTPKGYIWDSELNCWWKTSVLSTSPPWPFFGADTVEERVFAARNTSEGAVQIVQTSTDESSMLRALSYTFTPPLIELDHQQVVLRELEFYVQSFSANSTIDVTVTYPDINGGPDISTAQRQIVLAAATRHNVRMQVDLRPGAAHADWFKVAVTMTANSVEAPMLARMLVGVEPSTRYRGSA